MPVPDFPVIDAHTHIYPPEIVRDRQRFCEADLWFGELHASPNARLATAEDLLASMTAAGIDHSIVCGFPWMDASLCQLHNDYLFDACSRYPGQLSWLAIVSPTDPGATQATVDQASRGARGLGELNADAQGFIDDPVGLLQDVARFCLDADFPWMMHASEPVGHGYPGKGTAGPPVILAIAAAFPGLRLCAAHWGGGLPFYELMPEVRETARRIVYDTAATTYLYDPAVFGIVQQLVGLDRVLFASDFPVLGQSRLMEAVSCLQWETASDRRAVMGLNAQRFYAIEAGERGSG